MDEMRVLLISSQFQNSAKIKISDFIHSFVCIPAGHALQGTVRPEAVIFLPPSFYFLFGIPQTKGANSRAGTHPGSCR